MKNISKSHGRGRARAARWMSAAATTTVLVAVAATAAAEPSRPPTNGAKAQAGMPVEPSLSPDDRARATIRWAVLLAATGTGSGADLAGRACSISRSAQQDMSRRLRQNRGFAEASDGTAIYRPVVDGRLPVWAEVGSAFCAALASGEPPEDLPLAVQGAVIEGPTGRVGFGTALERTLAIHQAPRSEKVAAPHDAPEPVPAAAGAKKPNLAVDAAQPPGQGTVATASPIHGASWKVPAGVICLGAGAVVGSLGGYAFVVAEDRRQAGAHAKDDRGRLTLLNQADTYDKVSTFTLPAGIALAVVGGGLMAWDWFGDRSGASRGGAATASAAQPKKAFTPYLITTDELVAGGFRGTF